MVSLSLHMTPDEKWAGLLPYEREHTVDVWALEQKGWNVVMSLDELHLQTLAIPGHLGKSARIQRGLSDIDKWLNMSTTE